MKKIITQNQIKMEKYSNEELLEVLHSSLRETKELTPKQKVVLGQLFIYDGLDKKNTDGYFFRSNQDLCTDCNIKEEKTLIVAIRKLVSLGFIDTIRGSRRDGASLYRLNKKLIGDYCKTPVEDYSNDCSKQIVEMTDRIKELENTVKILLDKITVIEGRIYSTDTDIDKELDKEIEINNNILNNNSLNNILEETDRTKELEKEERKENFTESQLVLTESLASSPLTDSTDIEETQTSTEDESIPVEHHTIPTEDEQFQQWLQVVNPYLVQLESVQTLAQFEIIKNELKESGTEYLDNHDYTSPTVVEKMNKTVGSALRDKKAKLVPIEMELSDYLRVHNYGSL